MFSHNKNAILKLIVCCIYKIKIQSQTAPTAYGYANLTTVFKYIYDIIID